MRGCPAENCVYYPECANGVDNSVNCGNSDAVCHPWNDDELYALIMKKRFPLLERWHEFCQKCPPSWRNKVDCESSCQAVRFFRIKPNEFNPTDDIYIRKPTCLTGR